MEDTTTDIYHHFLVEQVVDIKSQPTRNHTKTRDARIILFVFLLEINQKLQ